MASNESTTIAEQSARWLVIGGAMWAGFRFFFRPFLDWAHRTTAERTFAHELERGKRSAEEVAELRRTIREGVMPRLDDLESEVARQAAYLEMIPDIKQLAVSAGQAGERTERAIAEMRADIQQLHEKVGEVRGAQAR